MIPQPDHPYAATVEELATALRATAVERDRAGGHPRHERELLRASGLLKLAVPQEFGGYGADWSTILFTVRRLAEADSALAHLFAFQHLQVASVLLYADPAQQARYLRATAERDWFWGNAVNPIDPRATARADQGRLRVDGTKSFCSGARGSDILLFSAILQPAGKLVVAAVPTGRAGITVHDDWDAIGQRQTDSGTVSFDKLLVEQDEVFANPGPGGSTYATLRPCLAQLTLVNLYLGIARGAFAEGRAYTLGPGRPWVYSGVDKASADPYIVHRYAELWLQIKAATALTDAAAAELDAAWARGTALTEDERGRCALAIAEAKVLAARAALDVSAKIFDAVGARATAARYGLDRFWRNARTHTLHDPLDYKLRDIGNWALNGQWPTPSFYS
ncbi:MAG: acyl-CoA dehydrogenase family protein [Burkholderiales bacterium]